MGFVEYFEVSDSLTATCRGKLQSRRCKLNQEINKELKLRAGAENLYKATSNRKLRETVALELSFVNSNLQLLQEQISELNSSVEIYQNDSYEAVMPLIPLGLKETKEINFMGPFSDFILEHYSEEPCLYEEAIADIIDTRQAARTPTRDANGVALLFRYYNLLYYVERRFFPSDRSLGIYFEWFDSLTGIPSCQRTVAFEKACILFNLGGIYTQIGAKQNRKTEKGLDTSIDNFLRAAGIFKHIHETFTNAPSMDLKPQILEILVSLMLVQARECLFEKLQLQTENFPIKDILQFHRDLSGEAAQLTIEFNKIQSSIRTDDSLICIPQCWIGFASLKCEYYKSLSHYHAAKSICLNPVLPSKEFIKKKSFRDNFIYDENAYERNVCPVLLKRTHLKESVSCIEEAQRIQRMCRDLKNKVYLTKYLQESHLKVLDELDLLDDEKNVKLEDYEVIDAPINPSSKFTLSLTGPDFAVYKIDDPFKKLGPIAIFSARRHWTVPRQVRLQKGAEKQYTKSNENESSKCNCKGSTRLNDSKICYFCRKYIADNPNNNINNINKNRSLDCYGFNLRGDAPVIISHVERNSLADLGGVKEGDFIVEISGIDVKWYSHRQVSKLVQESGTRLDLKIITPMDRNYLKPIPIITNGTFPTKSSTGLSGFSSDLQSPIRNKIKPKSKSLYKGKLSGLSSGHWNPFKRSHSVEKTF